MTVTDRTSEVTRSSTRSRGGSTGPSSGVGYRLRFGYWWWGLPAVLLVVVAIYLTTAAGAWYAFTDWTGVGPSSFVGLANFREIFSTPELFGSLVNTLLLAFGFVVLTNVLGLGFALALNRGLKTRYLLRTLVFMPVVIAPIAVSYVWKFIFAYDGPLNATLALLGLKGLQQDWLADPHLGLAAILVVMVWQSIGFAMVIYLAGLATVPVELEEAAALDGAGTVRRLFSLTLPMIQPSVAIATTLSLVQGLRVFDQVLALTGGGPADATQTLATQVYQQTFVFGKFGFGAALALILTLIILVFTVIQQYLTRDRV
jgi:raffinose/stachyose/melibiose transport system permease protein